MFRSHLDRKIENLRTEGCTALGPALAIAAGITASQPLSEVILCTDGEPNTGVGDLENNKEVGRQFYTKVLMLISVYKLFLYVLVSWIERLTICQLKDLRPWVQLWQLVQE